MAITAPKTFWNTVWKYSTVQASMNSHSINKATVHKNRALTRGVTTECQYSIFWLAAPLGFPEVTIECQSLIICISSAIINPQCINRKVCPEISKPCQWNPCLLQATRAVMVLSPRQDPVSCSIWRNRLTQKYQPKVPTTRRNKLLIIIRMLPDVYTAEVRQMWRARRHSVHPQLHFAKYTLKKFRRLEKYDCGRGRKSQINEPRITPNQ